MYKTIDLCAGIGGIRRGFEKTGHFTNILSAEIDEYAARTYSLNFNGDTPFHDLTSSDFKNEAKKVGCDVLMAGFPCQPFSSQGNQEGFEDPTKGTIFFDIKQIINKTRPKVVFLENVQNIISHDNKKTIHIILDSLEKKLEYKVIGVSIDENGKFLYKHDSFVRNTKNFGLPQNRPRAFFVAFDKRLYEGLLDQLDKELPRKLDARLAGSPYLGKSLLQILEPQVDIHYYMSETYLNTLKKHRERQKENGNGFGYCVLNKDGKEHVANTIMATGGSGKERNLVMQKTPCYDKDDPVVKKKKGGLNKENVRIMTPTEWGRLQGFIGYGFVNPETGVDEFKFPDNMPETQKYKQFGNAVSIPVAETMAYFIWDNIQRLNKNKEQIIFNYLKYYGYINHDKVKEIFDINNQQASYLLSKMKNKNLLEIHDNGRKTYYTRRKENDECAVKIN